MLLQDEKPKYTYGSLVLGFIPKDERPNKTGPRAFRGFYAGDNEDIPWVQADEGGRASIDKPRDKRKCEKTVEITEVDRFLGGSEQSMTTMQWIAEYTTLHGCKMPTCDDVYIDDIAWDKSPESKFQYFNGEEMSYIEYYRFVLYF